MSERLEYLRANSEAIKAIARRHKALSIAVFGSVARGDDRLDSDIDFLVDCDPSASLFDLVHMRQELATFLSAEVDLVDRGGLYPRDAHIQAESLAL
ncbi:MAG: nucleotidyltransferase domain-containing protein [Actinobacteria bacterium]|nr:nucleotidyltransferase domain-containing protein [Actinomycetota bacterium]